MEMFCNAPKDIQCACSYTLFQFLVLAGTDIDLLSKFLLRDSAAHSCFLNSLSKQFLIKFHFPVPFCWVQRIEDTGASGRNYCIWAQQMKGTESAFPVWKMLSRILCPDDHSGFRFFDCDEKTKSHRQEHTIAIATALFLPVASTCIISGLPTGCQQIRPRDGFTEERCPDHHFFIWY